MIAAVFWALTARDVTVNVALVCPAGMVTVDGTVTAADVLDNVTELAVDTAADNVAVPVAMPPEVTGFGEIATEASAAGSGFTVTVVLTLLPVTAAVTIAVVAVVTVPAVTVNVALV